MSWARFDKGGQPFTHKRRTESGNARTKQPIISPAFRDGRRYSDVLRGRRQEKEQNHSRIHETMQPTQATVSLPENLTLAAKIKNAVVVMTKKVMDMEEVEHLISDLHLPIVGVSSITPLQLVIFLEKEDDVHTVIAKESPLRRVFVDVRRWDGKETPVTRLAWLECKGIPPRCCSEESFRKIGDVWGRTVRVVDVFNGIHCLTSAKLLVDTNRFQRIEETIKVKWESGSKVVWVTEVNHSEHKEIDYDDDEEMEEQDDNEDREDTQGGDMFVCMEGETAAKEVNQMAIVEDTVHEAHLESLHEVTTTQLVSMGKAQERVNDETDILSSDDPMEDGQGTGLLELPQGQQVINTIPSVDEWWAGPVSCPARTNDVRDFDPMASVEATISQYEASQQKDGDNHGRRPRGRPKRVACSLPDTLSVPSTPSLHSVEANDTWQAASRVGVGCRDTSEIHEELRRSKRIQIMEASTPATSR